MTLASKVADARVARGAAWFDKDRPGWDRRMSLRRLDVADVEDCPAGQVYGHYRNAPYDIGPGRHFGFYSSYSQGDPSYGELNRAWRRLLKARGVKDDRPWFSRLWATLTRY